MNYKVILETAEKILSNAVVKSVLVVVIAIALYSGVSALLKARGK